jgi:hypothetical protein
MPAFTPDQIVAMAPDAASVKAGRDLAAPRKWALLGGDEEALWGLAQGSGKNPYQTQVLLSEPAFKCSCPSRKFPCKHGLGLLFIAAQQPEAITSTDRPDWVIEWLVSRAQRVEKAKERQEKKEEGTGPDTAAQEKRREKRGSRVDDGVQLLQQWLADLLKRGLADPGVTHFTFWEDMARRMIDAQATGLARRLRWAAEITRSGSGWETLLMDELGRLHLLLTAYMNRAELEENLRAEVEQAIGWTVPTDDVLRNPGITDDWFCAAQTVIEEDRLIISTTWLLGAQQRRWAQVSSVTPAHQRVTDRPPLGKNLRGDLAFYPGCAPIRALFKPGSPVIDNVRAFPATETFAAMLERHAAILALNPWRARMPFMVRAQPGTLKGLDVLVDESAAALPLRVQPTIRHILLALSGGQPIPLCGLWDGNTAEVLAAADGNDWISLTGGAP